MVRATLDAVVGTGAQGPTCPSLHQQRLPRGIDPADALNWRPPIWRCLHRMNR